MVDVVAVAFGVVFSCIDCSISILVVGDGVCDGAFAVLLLLVLLMLLVLWASRIECSISGKG